ncbi:MAG: hypothetical protein ACRDSK_07365 [Actinophytocola sp.]|uniref:hypothetical protein n=1 Tax=Actinophytocola sp. TaxID=1872138 RepID=UPI003D6B3E98
MIGCRHLRDDRRSDARSASWLKATTESLLKGDPQAWNMITKGMRTKATELIPGMGRRQLR